MTVGGHAISEADSTRLSVFNWAATTICIPDTLTLKTHQDLSSLLLPFCPLLFYSPLLSFFPVLSSSTDVTEAV